MSPTVEFPAANYFLATSRLIPGLDGGYTVSVLRRALDFAAVGGVQPTLLTFDLRIDYDALLARFVDLGLATPSTVLRNLFTELRATPSVLRDRAVANGVRRPAAVASGELGWVTDVDASGIPWRTVVTCAADDGGVETLYTDFADATGSPLFRLPYISGRADWHRADILVDVFGADGSLLGQLVGFGELYRVWLEHVIATSPPLPSIVVVEARQVGELLGDDPARPYLLVHTVHNAHTSAPHLWDSPMDASWIGWFETTAN